MKTAMFRLAHLSDAHLGPLPDVTYRELASKRAVGYINWQRNRRRHMHDSVIDTIVADVRASGADHIAVTGDLVNLALDGEIRMARQWLETLGEPRDVSVVPGNHDAYVPGAFAKVCREWAPWMSGDEISGDHHAGPRDHRDFPYLRIRGDIALIGVSSARATAPFMANGYLREGQGRRLAALLDETAARGLCRVVMIHHPPVRNAVPQHKRLFGIRRFGRIMKRHGAELVLHGHSHDPSLNFLDGANGPVPVVGVAAAGQAPGGKHAPAQYNLIDIAADGTGWNLKLTRRGLEGATLPPADLEVRDLVARPDEKVISVKSAERSA
jgi:3',5'-cyclic AMP phosphodiesterase CpdA